jgi:uncharacterized protein YyaL (SSP411 family)
LRAFGRRGGYLAAVEGKPRFTNRLSQETSPYLLQHAHNPVDWYPWGDEAFAEAKRTGKPVFLSVGYSTCHWCHVMERESFEDLEVARMLNESYVSIKVDREERPDIDAVYMTAVQALTGSGGWPMSVWLNADREPWFGGTYFPARDGDRGALRGFLSIGAELARLYRQDPLRVSTAAASLTRAVREAMSGSMAPGTGIPGGEAISGAVALYKRAFDDRFGGLRRAPKFPSNLPIRLLLRYHRRTGDAAALEMATLTLERMATGGLYDQVGGGFHRYSTDDRWLVPHFEKMLYDNALLVVAYAEGHQATGRPDFARVVRETLDYVAREMTAPEGGFYSATDADTEGEEGRFFVWEEREIRELLGAGADSFIAHYGVTAQGNFEGRNILHVPRPDEAAWKALEGARAKLYQARARRPAPLRDDKVLASWNGLMISGFAVGGRILAEPKYLEAARRAAAFALGALRPQGELMRSHKDGQARQPAFLEDHAFLAQGLLDLYEATFEARWLEGALSLAEQTEARFADRERGGWFTTGDRHEALLAREKPDHDGAIPSGASVALMNALRLAALTGDDRWRDIGDRALRAFAPVLADRPVALGETLLALDLRTDRPREVVLVWPRGGSPEPFLAALRRTFAPNRVLAGAAEGPELESLKRLLPPVGDKVAQGGQTTAYVCERGRCELPTTDPQKMLEQLGGPEPL